jgi:hypothetical protein
MSDRPPNLPVEAVNGAFVNAGAQALTGYSIAL